MAVSGPLFHDTSDLSPEGECIERVRLYCPACGREYVFCHVDPSAIAAYKRGAWRCQSCQRRAS